MSIGIPAFFGLRLHEIFFSSPWLSVKVHLFSRAVGREGHCKQISVACVGSTHSVPATLGLPPLVECMLSLSTLLWLQAALQGLGPELGALPRPKPLRFRFLGTPQRHRLSWACVLWLPWSEQLRQPGAWWAHSLQVQHDFSPPRPSLGFRMCWSGVPCVSPGWLRPSQRMSTIQNFRKSLVRNWKPICSLVGDAPFSLWLVPASHLTPTSGGGWASLQPASSPLVLLSPLFCEPAGYALG